MNIVVRMPNWIGDAVMATPVLSDLREAFPDASITAMCRGVISDLLEKEDAIDELFCFQRPNSGFERRRDQRDVIEKLQAGKYDIGILLTNSFSSAWLFWQGNVQRRIGFRKGFRSFLLSDALAMPKRGSEHQVLTYKRLLEPLKIACSNRPPRLVVSNEEMAASVKLLTQRGYREGSPLIGISPGAAYGSAKCWPMERFRHLTEQLLQEEGLFVVVFGDAQMAASVKLLYKDLPSRFINLTNLTSLRELMCLIRLCDVLVTNDSGPMHIGAAFQVPLVALFGSTDESVTGPFGQRGSVIRKPVSCAPCFKRECPIDFRCMKQIEVDDVFLAVRRARGLRV